MVYGRGKGLMAPPVDNLSHFILRSFLKANLIGVIIS